MYKIFEELRNGKPALVKMWLGNIMIDKLCITELSININKMVTIYHTNDLFKNPFTVHIDNINISESYPDAEEYYNNSLLLRY
jgi:hypothetical protein